MGTYFCFILPVSLVARRGSCRHTVSGSPLFSRLEGGAAADDTGGGWGTAVTWGPLGAFPHVLLSKPAIFTTTARPTRIPEGHPPAPIPGQKDHDIEWASPTQLV